MAYNIKDNAYFKFKLDKEEEEKQKRAAAQRRATNQDAREQKPVYGPAYPTTPAKPKYPTLQDNPITKAYEKNKKGTQSLLDTLMEDTGINPRKKETKIGLTNPEKVSASSTVRNIMLRQAETSPIVRSALRNAGVNDPLLDIYDTRAKKAQNEKKIEPLYRYTPIQNIYGRLSDESYDSLRNGIFKEIDGAKITNAERQKLKDKALTSKYLSQIAPQVEQESQRLKEIEMKYGNLNSPDDIREAIEGLDEFYITTRDLVGTMGENRAFVQERDPELLAMYDNYPNERKALVQKLEDMEEAQKIRDNQVAYSNYKQYAQSVEDRLKEKSEIPEKQYLGFKKGMPEYKEKYTKVLTGNKLIDNFLLSGASTPEEKALQEFKNTLYVRDYYENGLKSFVKLLSDMEKDEEFKQSILYKYASDEEYKKWFDQKAKLYSDYQHNIPWMQKNIDTFVDEYDPNNERYVEDYTKKYGDSPKWQDVNEVYKANKEIGQFGKGNIDLYNRPIYVNPDGSISTVLSTTIMDNGKYVLIPTIIETDRGRVAKVTPEQAIKHYKNTGEYLGKFDSEEKANQYADKLHKAQAFYYDSRYKSTKTGEGKYDAVAGMYFDTGFDDLTYDYINKNPEAIDTYGANLTGTGATMSAIDKGFLQSMSNDEVDIFNYIYKTQGADEAYKYIKNISGDLNRKRRLEKQEEWTKYAEENPGRATLWSVLTSPLKAVSDVAIKADYADDGKVDENSVMYDFVREGNTIKSTVKKKLNRVTNFIYDLGTSLGEQGLRALLASGNKYLSIGIAALGADAETYINKKDSGLTDGQALMLGGIAGAAEAISEAIGFDRMFGSKGWIKDGIVKNAIKSGVTELGEEGATGIANIIADAIVSKDKSEWREIVDYYKKPGATEGQAIGYAIFNHFAPQVARDMAMAFLSGGLMAGGTSTVQTVNSGINAITDSKEFKNYTDKIINADVSDYSGEASELQALVKKYVDQSNNAKTIIGQVIHAGEALGAASEYHGTPKVIVTEDISKEDRAKLNKFSKAANVNIIYSTIDQDLSTDYKGGFYVPGTNTMVIDKGTSAIDILDKTAAHEVGHTAEGTRWYDAYKRRVIADINESGSFNTEVQNKMDFYRENGVDLSFEKAEAEVIADYTSKLINDHSLIDKMVKKDYNTANLFLDGLRDVYNNLKSKVTGKEVGGVEETVRYLERAIGMRKSELTDASDVQYNITDNTIINEDTIFGIMDSLKGNKGIKYENGKTIKIPNTDMEMLRKTFREKERTGESNDALIDWVTSKGYNGKKDYFYLFYKSDDGRVAPIFRADLKYISNESSEIINIKNEMRVNNDGVDYRPEAISERFDSLRNKHGSDSVNDENVAYGESTGSISRPFSGQNEEWGKDNRYNNFGISDELYEGNDNKRRGRGNTIDSDAEYLELAKHPEQNKEKLRKIVDDVAEKNGYPIDAYHGTPNNDFTVFDKKRVGKGTDQYGAGFYFASNKESAKAYGTRVIETKLKLNNPIKINGSSDEGANLIDAGFNYLLTEEQAYEVIKRHPDIYDKEESPLGDYYDTYWENGVEDWMIRDMASNEFNRNIGYLDSDLFRNYPNELHEALKDIVGYDGVEVSFENGDKFYVAWFDNQMKSAEPVTYDDNGNIIPLSKRFNTGVNDLRYSISELTPEQKETLAKDQKLRDAEGKSKGVIISEFYTNSLQKDIISDEMKEADSPEYHAYRPISNAETYRKGKSYVQSVGLDEAMGELEEKFEREEVLNSKEVAEAEYIVIKLQQDGRVKDAVRFVRSWNASVSEGARALQALRILDILTPEGKYMYLDKSAQAITDKQIESFKGKNKKDLIKELEEAKKKDAETRRRIRKLEKDYEEFGDVAALMELSDEEFGKRHKELIRELEDMQSESEGMKNKILKMQETQKLLEKTKKTFEAQEKEANSIDKKIENIQKKIATLKEESSDIEEKREELENLRKEREFLKTEKEKYGRLPGRIAKVEQKIDSLQLEIAGINERRAELIEKGKKMNMFKNELKDLKKKYGVPKVEEVYEKYGVEYLSEKDKEYFAETIKTLDALKTKKDLINFILKQNEKRGIKNTKVLKKALSKENAKDLKFLKDTAWYQMLRSIEDMEGRSIYEKAMALRMASMLSGIPTFMRNYTSNNVFGGMESFVTNFSLPADIIVSWFTKERSVNFDNFGLGKEQKKVSKEAYRRSQIAIGTDTQRGNGKYGLGRKAVFKNRALAAFERHVAHSLQNVDMMNEAGIKLNVTKQLERLRKAGRLDITDEEIEQMAQQEADYRLFKDNNLVNTTIAGVKKALNNIGAKNKMGQTVIGLGDFVAPFVMVPGSIVMRGFEYTPMGYLKAIKSLAEIRKSGGQNVTEQRKAVLALTRATTGSTLIGISYFLAQLGIIFGDKEDDSEENKMQNITKSQGLSGYQLNISGLYRLIVGEDTKKKDGDVLIKFDFLEPLANNMAIGYALNEIRKQEAKENSEKVKDITFNILSLSTAKFFDQIQDTSGFSTIKTLFDKNLSGVEKLLTVGADALTSFIPRQISQTAKLMDTKQRSAYLEKDSKEKFLYMLMDDIPGLRSKVPAKVSHFGEELDISLGNKVADFFNIFINPGTASIYKSDKVTDEVIRVYEATKESAMLPTNLNKAKEISFNRGVKQEVDGWELNEYAQTIGKALAENYSEFINSEEYQKLTDAERAESFRKIKNGVESKYKTDFAIKNKIYKDSMTSDSAYIEGEKGLLEAKTIINPKDAKTRYGYEAYNSALSLINGAEKKNKLTPKIAEKLRNVAQQKSKEMPKIMEIIAENGYRAGAYNPLNMNYARVFSWTENNVSYELPMTEDAILTLIDYMEYYLPERYADLYTRGYYTEGGKTKGPELGTIKVDEEGHEKYATWGNMSPKQRNSKLVNYRGRLAKEARAELKRLFKQKGIKPTKVSTVWDVEGDEEE